MSRIIRCVLTLVALALTQFPFAHAAEQVDLLLVLAMDVSRSMDQAKFQLQRQGYAAAISDPRVLHAIESGPHQKIAVCFIDWSGPFEQKLVIDWSILDGPAAASRFADLIVEAPRSFLNSTSIGSAIDFATAQIAKAPFEAERHAIDVSGDGTNNAGRDVRFFRDRAVANDIVVNGIVILTDIQFAQNPAHTNPPGGIEKYYRDNVIGGPGSFVVVAEDYNSFGRAMVKKLIAEIAIDPAQRPAQHRSTEVNAIGWTQERESLPTDWRRRDDIGPDGERGSCPRRVDDPRRGRRRTGLAQRRIRRIEPFFLKTTPS